LKEALLSVRIMAELVAEDPKGTGRVAEAAGDFERRQALKEVCTESFVLSVQRIFGGAEETGDGR
jgi:hypothetical protein